MKFFDWLLRCIPGLSNLLLLAMLEWALGIGRSSFGYTKNPVVLDHMKANVGLYIFMAYSLILHFLAFFFPIRLCRSAWAATKQIREVHTQSRQNSLVSESSSDMSSDESHVIQEPVLSEKLQITMVGIVPSYKEDIGTLEDTLKVLASHSLARTSYDIFLAMEERDPNGRSTAEQLIARFKSYFMDMQYTVHPANIQGEAAGKSSNISWAAKEVETKYASRANWKDVLVTVMDSDTHLLDSYFRLVREQHLINRQQDYMANMTLYVPPIVFDRNAHKVPRLVRMADLMWCGAGLSCYRPDPSRTAVIIPTAVYTVTLPLVRLANGWDTGPNSIGEDMHMMLKCYYRTHGRLNIQSIASPASQCNVCTDVQGIRGWFANHSARYSQGLRHMWGSLDTGFAIKQWVSMGKKSTEPNNVNGMDNNLANLLPRRSRKLSHSELSLKLNQNTPHGADPSRFTIRNFTLFLRLFEAHFLPSHLFTILVVSALYTSLSNPLSRFEYLNYVLDITAYLRTAGFFAMTVYFVVFYEAFHKSCVEAREWEMKKAGLYEDLEGEFSHRTLWRFGSVVDYLIFPVAGTLFGSIPLFQATFSHFWSERLVYLVSAKPVRAAVQAVQAVEGALEKSLEKREVRIEA